MDSRLTAFERLLNIMDDLREKCPWDRKQTIDSLRILTIEETYEMADAIIDKDMSALKEELGDVLLHIIFYAKIASEKKAFDITQVINDLCDKLVKRHPHIYGNVIANTDEQVKKNWELIKQQNTNRSLLAGVPVSLPAIVKAYRMQEKARQVGFEWENKIQVWKKVDEELQEFKVAALKPKEEIVQEDIESEFGDLLFSLINLSRFIDVDPEAALEKTNKKFKNRFQLMEEFAEKNNRKLKDMSLEEMDVLWNQTKVSVP